MSTVLVGMGDYKIAKGADALMTIGLGSCIGVCIYDQAAKIAGMAHIMLPSSRAVPQSKPLKYADTCLEIMLKELNKLGGMRLRLKAKMAGGAQMFASHGNTTMHIGEKNMMAVTEELKKYGIPLVAKDVGGSSGRTITFNTETSELFIKTVKANGKVI